MKIISEQTDIFQIRTPWRADVILALTLFIEIIFLTITWNAGSIFHNKEGVLASPWQILDHLDELRCLHVPVVQHLSENAKFLTLGILQSFYFFTNHEARCSFSELLKTAILHSLLISCLFLMHLGCILLGMLFCMWNRDLVSYLESLTPLLWKETHSLKYSENAAVILEWL